MASEALGLLPGEAEIKTLALRAFDAAGCSGWGRVDLMRDRSGNFFLLEVNTTPGMTSHSLVPKAAKVVGIDFAQLCWRILETSLVKEPVAGSREPVAGERAAGYPGGGS